MWLVSNEIAGVYHYYASKEEAEKCLNWYRSHLYLNDDFDDYKLSEIIPENTFCPPMSDEEYNNRLKAEMEFLEYLDD